MTEDEAKKRACFEAATFGASQQVADGPGPHCIASQCMAWRWAVVVNKHGDRVRSDATDTPTGYCGKAGQPRAERP